jgi:hypothetical protein
MRKADKPNSERDINKTINELQQLFVNVGLNDESISEELARIAVYNSLSQKGSGSNFHTAPWNF